MPGNLGERIQRLRLEKGLSLSELAEKSTVAKSYLSNVERNIQKNLSIHMIEKIADALDVTMYTILYGDLSDVEHRLDPDWLEMVEEATTSGISKRHFKEYVQFHKWKMSTMPKDINKEGT